MYCHRPRFSGSYLPLILSCKTILIILAVAAIAVGVACGGGDDEGPGPQTKNDLVDQRFECEVARLRLGGTQVSERTVVGWHLEGYDHAKTMSWEALKSLRDFHCGLHNLARIPSPTPDAPTYGLISP